jgi:Transcription factor WhiB
VTRQETPAQVERRRERDRANKALARARAKGLEIPGTPRGTPPRRVFLPVSRAPKSDWQDRAACKGEPPEWFDAETADDAARALAVCARCPVRRECLTAAAANNERYGVWGGIDLSAPERPAVAS